MKENNKKKMKAPVEINSYPVSPDKSADPPQPQGKQHKKLKNKKDKNDMG